MTGSSTRSLRLQQDRQRLMRLVTVYGTLLKHDRSELLAAYIKGTSLSELARQRGVTRQAIHEALRLMRQRLEHYEDSLGLLEASGTAEPSHAPGKSSHPARASTVEAALQRLRELQKGLRESGIIYSADSILSQLDEAINMLSSGHGFPVEEVVGS